MTLSTFFGKNFVFLLVMGMLACGIGWWLFVQRQQPVAEIKKDYVSEITSLIEQQPATTTAQESSPTSTVTLTIDQKDAKDDSEAPKEDLVPIEESKPKVLESDLPKPTEAIREKVKNEEVAETEWFVVAIDGGEIGLVGDALLEQGFIKDKDVFIKVFAVKEGEMISPGGYRLSKGMNSAQISGVLRNKPYMKWVVIPEGLRKEEIAKLLADALGWTAAQKAKWMDTYTAMKFDYIEGTYFPDTYLIPIDEEPLKVAERLQSKFNEKFAVYLPEFSAQNIKWTTGLTFASIVQREAANKADMPLIAGILWNRLEQNMALNVDATLQYARGDAGSGWWAPLKLTDKQTESPYNTYLNKGLPPHPICNPGITAIEATINPAKTDCLYYLHDKNHITHCAKTYEEHQENIERYLKK